MTKRFRGVVEAMEVAGEHQDPQPIRAAHLQSIDRDVLIPSLRIGRDDEPRGDVRAGVVLVVHRNREVAVEVDVADDLFLRRSAQFTSSARREEPRWPR